MGTMCLIWTKPKLLVMSTTPIYGKEWVQTNTTDFWEVRLTVPISPQMTTLTCWGRMWCQSLPKAWLKCTFPIVLLAQMMQPLALPYSDSPWKRESNTRVWLLWESKEAIMVTLSLLWVALTLLSVKVYPFMIGLLLLYLIFNIRLLNTLTKTQRKRIDASLQLQKWLRNREMLNKMWVLLLCSQLVV